MSVVAEGLCNMKENMKFVILHIIFYVIQIHCSTISYVMAKILNLQCRLSCCIRKLTIHISKNTGADQLCSNCTADQHLSFCSIYYTVLCFFIPSLKFQAYSYFLWLFSLVCLRPVGWNPRLLVFSWEGSFLF